MAWSTVQWPPKNGKVLRKRPSLRKRILKYGLIGSGILFFSLALLMIVAKFNQGMQWPYPLNYLTAQEFKILNKIGL